MKRPSSTPLATPALYLLLLPILVVLLSPGPCRAATGLPEGFVYLSDVAPTILQEMRYHGTHNFLGRPVDGYEAPVCILTRQAAETLADVQDELNRSGLSLKVYDCYRPARAVEDFARWAEDVDDQKMKAEFYPNVDKKDFYDLGYVARRSSHSRGSTADLTIVPLPVPEQPAFVDGQALLSCTAPKAGRFADNSLDMGTGFDCFDPLSHPANRAVGPAAYHLRMILQELMVAHGFAPYDEEWWHFTLKGEPFPETYFDFPVAR